MRPRIQSGFTLVELLVVIGIIAVLVGLTLPAVNSARESGRRTQCMNNLAQMARACLNHESKYGYLPTGGWGRLYAGDPDLGVGKEQPGGWHYNILPFLELADLHDLGKRSPPTVPHNPTANDDRVAGRTRAEMPVAVFICPTRHRLQNFPRQQPDSKKYVNINDPDARSGVIGRSDYAANAGDNADPNLIHDGDPADLSAARLSATLKETSQLTGVIYRMSTISMAAISDGPAQTYLIGERYLCPDNYYNGTASDNDQGWDMGYDTDVNRWTEYDPVNKKSSAPMQDRPPDDPPVVTGTRFGSAHAVGFNMAFCDGHTARIGYAIDPEVHRTLGNRSDRNLVPQDTRPNAGKLIDLSEVIK